VKLSVKVTKQELEKTHNFNFKIFNIMRVQAPYQL